MSIFPFLLIYAGIDLRGGIILGFQVYFFDPASSYHLSPFLGTGALRQGKCPAPTSPGANATRTESRRLGLIVIS